MTRLSNVLHVVLQFLATRTPRSIEVLVCAGLLAAFASPSGQFQRVDANDASISMSNGTLLWHNRPFSGHLEERHGNGQVKRVASYRHGRLDGQTAGWYENGQRNYVRSYRGGREVGTHRGWYENGASRFEYHFAHGVSVGLQQQWYRDGAPYTRFHYVNGQEAGQQQMWNTDGTLRANYVIRDGRRFGLPGSTGCRGKA